MAKRSRIVEIADPQAAISFGSHAKGRSHLRSDLDLMIIVDSDETEEIAGDLDEAMADLADGRWDEVAPLNISVVTPQEWRYQVQLSGLICFRIHRHGVVWHGQAA